MNILLSFCFIIVIASCTHPNRQFTFEETKFFNAYKPGDTMVFESSLHDIDTFEIITIDSSLRTVLGFFGHEVQNDKMIFIRQLPIDTSRGMTEDFIKKNKLDYHEFLSAHKHPDEKRILYCIRFKEFEACTENSFGQFIDTVTIMGRKLTNCYTFENRHLQGDSSALVISNIYWTIDSGFVAYKLVNGTEWVRKDFR